MTNVKVINTKNSGFMHDASRPFAVVYETENGYERIKNRYATESIAKGQAKRAAQK